MLIVIHGDLSVESDPEAYPLDRFTFEAEVGPAELAAAERAFAHRAGPDIWSFHTPTGGVDLQRINPTVGRLRASKIAALPWVYKMLFDTPKGFVSLAVPKVGAAAATRAYAEYLDSRMPVHVCHRPAEDTRRLGDIFLHQAADVDTIVDLPAAGLIERLQASVATYVMSRNALLNVNPDLDIKIYEDHVETLAALAVASRGSNAVDTASRPEPKTGSRLTISTHHVPQREIDLLASNMYRISLVSREDGAFVRVPDATRVSPKARKDLPIVTTLFGIARAKGCAWLDLDEDADPLEYALLVTQERTGPPKLPWTAHATS